MTDAPQMRIQDFSHTYRWSDAVMINVERFESRKEGLFAECEFRIDKGPGVEDEILEHSNLNLSVSSSRKTLAKNLAMSWPAVNLKVWEQRLKYFTYKSKHEYRNGGAPALDLSQEEPDLTEESMLLDGLLPKYGATIQYGAGASGKSMFALAQLLTIASGDESILGIAPAITGPVMYLDWEDDSRTVTERKRAILNGRSIPKGSLIYRQMPRSIVDAEDLIKKDIAEHGIVALCIDSLGLCMNSDPTDASATIKAMNVAHRLGISAILISHLSKQQTLSKDLAEKMSPFGSIYGTNSARYQLLVEVAPQYSEEEKQIFVHNTKANHHSGFTRQSFTVQFENTDNGWLDSVRYERASSRDYDRMMNAGNQESSVKECIIDALEDDPHSSASVESLMYSVRDALNREITTAQIRSELSRGRKKGLFIKTDKGFWRLDSGNKTGLPQPSASDAQQPNETQVRQSHLGGDESP